MVTVELTDINDNVPLIDYKFIRENIIENTIGVEVTVFKVIDHDSDFNGDVQVTVHTTNNNNDDDDEYLNPSELYPDFYVVRLIRPIDYEAITNLNFNITLCDRGVDQKCCTVTVSY